MQSPAPRDRMRGPVIPVIPTSTLSTEQSIIWTIWSIWSIWSPWLLLATGHNLKRLLQQPGWGRRPFPSGAAAGGDFFVLRRLLMAVLEGEYAGCSPQ